jgi:hypothetical protein
MSLFERLARGALHDLPSVAESVRLVAGDVQILLTENADSVRGRLEYLIDQLQDFMRQDDFNEEDRPRFAEAVRALRELLGRLGDVAQNVAEFLEMELGQPLADALQPLREWAEAQGLDVDSGPP